MCYFFSMKKRKLKDPYKIEGLKKINNINKLESYIFDLAANTLKNTIPFKLRLHDLGSKTEQSIIKLIYSFYIAFSLSFVLKTIYYNFTHYIPTNNLLITKAIYKKTLFYTIAIAILHYSFSSFFFRDMLIFFARFIAFYVIKRRKIKVFSFDISRHLLIAANVLYVKHYFLSMWKEIFFLYNNLIRVISLIMHIMVFLIRLLLKQMPFLLFTKNFTFFRKPLKEKKIKQLLRKFLLPFEIAYISIYLVFLYTVTWGDISCKKIPSYLALISTHANAVTFIIKKAYQKNM